MTLSISKKIALLNQTTLDLLVEKNSLTIIGNFTETGLKIMGADFGFAWWKMGEEEEKKEYQLAYKTSSTPYNPNQPREKGGNFEAKREKRPFFVESVQKKDYEKAYDVSPYMKSYVIIPVTYENYIYGSIVLCFKKKHIFTKEERSLALSIGNATAQAVTFHRLVLSEKGALLVKEKLAEEKLRTEFIADATHEIRTPLAIIRGNVDLALGNRKAGKLKSPEKALRAINYEVEHLSHLLADLTLLTSREAEFEKRALTQKVDLSRVIQETVKRVGVLAKKRKISIELPRKFSPLLIKGDITYLEKLFLNLLKNAITYNNEGGWVKIEASKAANKAVVTVKDNGIGISKEDLPLIFGRFYRAEKVRDPEGKRTGLGLAISKWITEIHKGTIHASSTLNKGSTFTVFLPLLKQE
ncbi:MAG: ATP-binding protein [Candidatus Pacebacteria bacterium]|nr:ATP-binding protein [Candidatus Paceibacterota bacterium]